MNQQIDAIYDDGVLKPLVPLALPDKTRVKLTVVPHEIDQLPQTRNNDGWSVRQHDELLYGGK